MHVAFLILAHHDPVMLHRLCKRLTFEKFRCYVHLDKSADIDSFAATASSCGSLHMLPMSSRVPVSWGDFSIVQASLNLLQAAQQDTGNEWFVLLSGQDYPLNSNQAICEFFRTTEDNAFVETAPIAKVWPTWERRVHHYKFINTEVKSNRYVTLPSIWRRDFWNAENLEVIKQLTTRGKFSALTKVLRKRRFPLPAAHGGGAWWAFSRQVADKVTHAISTAPHINRYFRDSLLPDEVMFQSLLASVERDQAPSRYTSLTYTNWSRSTGRSPVTFTTPSDCEELMTAGDRFLFARKFSSTASANVLDYIDTHLPR